MVFMGFINQRSHHWGVPSCSYIKKMFVPKKDMLPEYSHFVN